MWMAEARTCEMAISSLARYEGNDRARRAQEVEELFEVQQSAKFESQDAEFDSSDQNDIATGRDDGRRADAASGSGGGPGNEVSTEPRDP
jgi:hypothetical protein